MVAQDYYTPKIRALIEAAGAGASGAFAQSSTPDRPSPEGNDTPVGLHTMGGLRMGPDPSSGVTDPFGRLYGLENVGVADGSVFPSSGSLNPTLTIVATAWRNARSWAGLDGDPEMIGDPAGGERADTSDGSSDGDTKLLIGGLAAAAAAGGAAAYARSRRHRAPDDVDSPAREPHRPDERVDE